MINKRASKWSEGVLVTIDRGDGDGPETMAAAHVFDNPDETFDGDGFVLYMPSYWYNRQPGASAPWLRSSWLLNVKVEPDGDGFKFDGPTGRGTIVPFDYFQMGYNPTTRSLYSFESDLQAAGTSFPEEWARIDREELAR